jgi:Ca2+-binding RTX toxin-like protein
LDLLVGGGGDDELEGSEGIDVLHGDQPSSGIITRLITDFGFDPGDPGASGKDKLSGGPDNDDLFGGPEDDELTGGPGNDHLDGEEGTNDECDGGAGNFDTVGAGCEVTKGIP